MVLVPEVAAYLWSSLIWEAAQKGLQAWILQREAENQGFLKPAKQGSQQWTWVSSFWVWGFKGLPQSHTASGSPCPPCSCPLGLSFPRLWAPGHQAPAGIRRVLQWTQEAGLGHTEIKTSLPSTELPCRLKSDWFLGLVVTAVLQLIRLDGGEFIYLELSVIDLNKLLK